MRIGIDIDDTLTETNAMFSKYLKKYYRLHHLGRFSSDLRLNKEDFANFMAVYSEEIYRNMKWKKGACDVLKKWASEGHEIYIVTARCEQDYPKIEEYTKAYFQEHGIVYHDIVFGSKNKYKDSQKFHLDVFIDNREDVLNTFPAKDLLLLRMVPKKSMSSKYCKVTSWKEIDRIITNL